MPGYCCTLLLYGSRKASLRSGKLASDLGGAEGIRTPGLLVANEARYQLRHSPMPYSYGVAPTVLQRRTVARCYRRLDIRASARQSPTARATCSSSGSGGASGSAISTGSAGAEENTSGSERSTVRTVRGAFSL